MNNHQQRLAELIREGRKAAELTQVQLAEALDLKQSTISEWEAGKFVPTVSNLLRLASILDLDISSLVEKSKSRHSAA